eukprot:CCRYP_016560-RA/>CCRYP_016560-RA protein AED:0.30 eAED:0.30 QI:170/1/1/1/0/0/2/306/60
MPWQAVPSLLIIVGAFNVAAGLVLGIDYLQYGKRREIGHNQWTWAMSNRDTRLQELAKNK